MTTLGSIIGGEAGKSLKDHGIAEGTATAKAALFAEVNHLAPFSLNLCPHSGKVSKVSWCIVVYTRRGGSMLLRDGQA